MLPPLAIPDPEPPQVIPGYNLPAAPQLTWAFVAEQMTAATYYWIASAATDGRPHAVPLWGLWHENRIHFDGSPHTRWARNLIANPAVAVHLPDAERVVVIEGRAEMLADDALTEAEWAVLDSAYRAKYRSQGSPFWFVQPRLVLAWDGANLGTMTRWRFG